MRKLVQTKQILLSLVAVALAASPALADTGNEAIDKGIALYNDLEYETAIEVLNEALADPNLSMQEMTEGYSHLGLCYLALGQEAPARAAFLKLLEANRDFKLPRTVNQRALDIFAEVKSSLPELVDEVQPVNLTQTVSPIAPKVGNAISVGVIIVDPDRRHNKVVIYHRVRGDKSYSEVKALSTATGRYAVTISGAFVKDPALEYYVAAFDATGELVTSEGTAEQPLTIAVGAKGKAAAPIYARWWFWGAIGAVAAGTVAIIALSGGGGTPDPDATVTITVDYP